MHDLTAYALAYSLWLYKLIYPVNLWLIGFRLSEGSLEGVVHLVQIVGMNGPPRPTMYTAN